MIHDPGHLKGIKQEFDVNLMLSDHPNIVKLVGWDQVHGTRGEAMAVAVMEFCPGGSVYDLMLKRQAAGSKIEEREIWEIFGQVCLGVQHMHRRNPPIIHRDLKVENVLLAQDGYVPRFFGCWGEANRQENFQDLRLRLGHERS